MLSIKSFKGMNNVLTREELSVDTLTVGSNIDLDLAGSPSRRKGYTVASATQHANVWKAPSGVELATRGAGGDLINVGSGAVLLASLGHTPRLWYCALPDGRIVYSNGTVIGAVNAAGTAAIPFGVPIPASLGAAAATSGLLDAGTYQYALTYRRASDGAEGGPAYSAPVVLASANAGLALTGLPVLAGYRINVYLTSANGGKRFLAGYTSGSTFTYAGKNKDLVRACRTEFMLPASAGKLLAFWRGRLLVAVGNALFASRPYSWELFDVQKDFKPFGAPITLVQPVRGGVFVGTEQELAFLAGDKFDTLVYRRCVTGRVPLGSGAVVPDAYLKGTDQRGTAEGDGMVCIADGVLTAGLPTGDALPLTENVYRASGTEYAATFRLLDGVPQYIAIPQ